MKSIVLSICFLLLAACGKSYSEHIAGSYYLIDGDPAHVYLIDTQKRKTMIDQQVVAVEKDDNYIMVLREPASSYECADRKNNRSIITNYNGTLEYWVINTNTHQQTGPLTHDAYVSFVKEQGLPDLELDSSTNYFKSNDGNFEEWGKNNCVKLEPI